MHDGEFARLFFQNQILGNKDPHRHEILGLTEFTFANVIPGDGDINC